MTEKIKITFLGTADSVPSAKRNHTAILLSYKDENILVDCGEGTQRQFRMVGLNPCKITKILITHWHGDHVLGIPGLLQTLAFSGYNKTLHIYGPKGTKEYMNEMFRVFAFSGNISLKVEEISNGVFFDNGEFFLEAERMQHGVPCNAYNFVKKGQIRIDKKKLKKSKIKEGPHLQELKKGKDIVFNGNKYFARNLTFSEKGKKISFVLDTGVNERIAPFAKDADLLVIESSFDAESMARAKEYNHLTCEQGANIAKKAKVNKLVLTHVSQRYDNNPLKVLKQSKKIFRNSFLASDFNVFEV
ncbi:MAG: ribonuclease Z [Nanoarchaeota archaeon]